jgi:hypothetical protein
MSDRSQKKPKPERARRRRGSKDKPIRLEDLLPKDDVTGGRHVFGVTNESLDEPRRKKES